MREMLVALHARVYPYAYQVSLLLALGVMAVLRQRIAAESSKAEREGGGGGGGGEGVGLLEEGCSEAHWRPKGVSQGIYGRIAALLNGTGKLRLRKADFLLGALLLAVPDYPLNLCGAAGVLFVQLHPDTVTVRTQLAIALEAWTVFAIKCCYELTRNLFGSNSGDSVAAEHNALRVVAAERALGIFYELDWQRAVLGWTATLRALNWYYVVMHFTATFGALLLVLLVSPAAYYLRRRQFIIIMAITLVTFAVFPLMPPRLLPQCHHPLGACHPELAFVDTLAVENVNWDTKKVVKHTNQYAAMPSVHTVWAHWAADMLFHNPKLWPNTPTWQRARWLVWLHPVITVYTIVVTGNHFFLDAVVGMAYVHFSEWAASAAARRRLFGAERRATEGASTEVSVISVLSVSNRDR